MNRIMKRMKIAKAGLGVGPDRDVLDGDQQLSGLDDRLERVREPGDGLHRQRRLAVISAKARGGVRDLGRRRLADHPGAQALEQLLARREVRDRPDLAVADDHVRVTAENWSYELWDIRTLVLVVGVGVDDHVGAELEAGVEAGLEGGRQALVVGQANDVVDTGRASYLDRAVR
jgi:hypothetical protein